MKTRAQKSVDAERRFLASVADAGAQLAPGASYRGANTPVQLICKRGHACSPQPNSIRGRRGICRTCAGRDPVAAEAAFWDRVAELGGTPAPGASYRGADTPVQLICKLGHACSPRPHSVRDGRGICRTCATLRAGGRTRPTTAAGVQTREQSRLAAERRFLASVAAAGAQLSPGASYRGANTRVQLICKLGHACRPRPSSVQQGGGICHRCIHTTRVAAAAAQFWALVADWGAFPTPGATYRGASTRVQLICKLGHACSPRPADVQQRQGPCRVCAGRDPASSEAAFWSRVVESRATAAPGATYKDNRTHVQLICENGHVCNPRPFCVMRGDSVCGECVVSFDRVYLVKHVATGAIKVGIASGDARVNAHVGRGYELVVQWLGMTHARAREVETQAHAWWRAKGWQAVDAAPKDGWTETAGMQHLSDTRAWMSNLLGPGTCPEAA